MNRIGTRVSYVALCAAVVLPVFAACGSKAPNGFQIYKLGASRQSISRQMGSARQLGVGELLVYSFLSDDQGKRGVERWLDHRRVGSGDSVTAIVTFDDDRVARVDVMYPLLVALDGTCPICAALRADYGQPTEVDSTTMPPSAKWRKWPCCELRLARAGPVLVVSYIERGSVRRRNDDSKADAARAGRRQLQ